VNVGYQFKLGECDAPVNVIRFPWKPE